MKIFFLNYLNLLIFLYFCGSIIPLIWKTIRPCHPHKGWLILLKGMDEKKKVIVYVDGFNFYYGLKHHSKWKKYYWLDIVKLFEQFMRPDQELVAVKYFSARPNEPQKSTRQNAFFQANLENPKFKLILGHYLCKNIPCRKCGNIIHTYEEKESDVRFATQIVTDALCHNCDISIVVSADSDMIPAIEIALNCNHPAFVYFPPNQYSNDLANIAGAPILLSRYESRFKKSLFPDIVHLAKSNFDLQIPPEWKSYQ